MGVRFNGDTGNNYAWQNLSATAANTNATSTSMARVYDAAAAAVKSGELFVVNIASREKSISGVIVSPSVAGAANVGNYRIHTGKWANTSDAISSVTLVNDSTGDFAIGSELIVLGHD